MNIGENCAVQEDESPTAFESEYAQRSREQRSRHVCLGFNARSILVIFYPTDLISSLKFALISILG